MTFRIYGTAIMTILAATSLSALAQPVELPQEEVEQVPNKKLEERGERIKGPITSISPAALLFASFDKNSDYAIDDSEYAAGLTASFEKADKDASGTLSLFELEDWRKASLGSLDARPGNISFDKDFDLRVSKAEFEKAFSYIQKRNDKDSDGIISFEEMVRVFEMPRRSRSESGNGGRRAGGGRAGGGRQGGGQGGQRPTRR